MVKTASQAFNKGQFIFLRFFFFFFFFNVAHFKVFIAFVTLLLLLFMFWFFGSGACGVLAPEPGIRPTPPALEGEVSPTRPPEKSLTNVIKRE